MDRVKPGPPATWAVQNMSFKAFPISLLAQMGALLGGTDSMICPAPASLPCVHAPSQVLSSGTGARRHPLFFLQGLRRKVSTDICHKHPFAPISALDSLFLNAP